ncbi:hypothetical protein WBG78_08300 [Chryseolinea sp. T2]|uniref:hypothetical protein n=1 Tax=Chryseolinea sp. T2 TaxID=3129255 RepID=UPI0030788665
MKKHLALMAFIMAAAVVSAQEKGRGDHHRDMAEKMKTELSLSDDQYEKIKVIDKSYKAKFHDLRSDSTKTKEVKVKSMHSLSDTRKKEVESVLTEEQRSKWQAQQSARRDEHRAHGQRVANDRAEKIRKDLSLSDAQFEKFQKANAAFRRQAHELKQKQLSDDTRKNEFSKLRKNYDKSIKSIFSKDQYKKWSEMKKDRSHNNGRHMRQEPKGS